MKRPVLPALAGILLCSSFAPAWAIEILRWERLPLTVPLVVGQERVIFIDRNVRVSVPFAVGDRLRVQSAGGAVYLRANQPMASTRLQLQDVESGQLILLDVAAEQARAGQAALEPVRIVEGDVVLVRSDQAGAPGNFGLSVGSNADDAQRDASGSDAPTTRRRETPVAVVLTRYAAQSLYAPLRTVEPLAGVSRVDLARNLALDTLMPTLPVRAFALDAWRLEDQWVTAVRLTNATAAWLDLDPRALQGDFVAATFQHPTLGPAGQSTDTTVVYLVTRGHGLAESLLPKISRIDAGMNLSPAGIAGAAQGASDEK